MSVSLNKLIASDILQEGLDCSLGYYKLNEIAMDILMKPHESVFDESSEIVSAIDIDFESTDSLF